MALSWGMTWELFWQGPLNAFNCYAEKNRLEQIQRDRDAWMNGRYVQEALRSVYHMFNPFVGRNPKIYEYPGKPFEAKRELTPEQKRKHFETAELIKQHNLHIQAMLVKGG